MLTFELMQTHSKPGLGCSTPHIALCVQGERQTRPRRRSKGSKSGQPKSYARAGTDACGPGGRPLIEGDDDRDAGSN